jgi:hypothetical protein
VPDTKDPPSSAPTRLAVGFGPKELSPTLYLSDSPLGSCGPLWVPRPPEPPRGSASRHSIVTLCGIRPVRLAVNTIDHRFIHRESESLEILGSSVALLKKVPYAACSCAERTTKTGQWA